MTHPHSNGETRTLRSQLPVCNALLALFSSSWVFNALRLQDYVLIDDDEVE